MTGKKIGYIRVSTPEQNPDRQLSEIQLDKVFIEKASGKSSNRPELENMLEYIRDDDIVYVHSMDRLARNLKNLKELVTTIVGKNAKIVFVKEGLTFDGNENSMSNFLLNVMGAFAEFEHAFINERLMEGIRRAKEKGVYKRPENRKVHAAQKEYIRQQLNGRKALKEIANDLKISRVTLYRYMKEMGLSHKSRSCPDYTKKVIPIGGSHV